MKTFVNRHEELGFLEKEYKRDGASLVILYGRRRVGKTALIAEFIKDKQAVYFLATEEDELHNRMAFQNSISKQAGIGWLMDAGTGSWDMIFQAWLDTPYGEKKLMAADEFQYLGKAKRTDYFASVYFREALSY